MPRLVVIGERDYFPHLPENNEYSGGLVPRNFAATPVGSLPFLKPWDMPLIPRNEIQDRIDQHEKDKSSLDYIRLKGNAGGPIPSRDQDGYGYSHVYGTEVLTDKGWVAWQDYNGTDLLASVNQLTHLMEFQAPTERHEYEYVDEMYYSTNRRLDFGVTRNHRMLVRKWDEGRRTLSDAYSLQRADELGWYVGMMAAPRGFIGTNFDRITIQGDRTYDGDDFVALVALVTSDGYAGGSDNSVDLVSFCCFHDHRYPLVEPLARRLGFSEQPGRRGVWNRTSPALAAWVRSNCYTGGALRSPNKKVPDFVKCASGRQIRHFLRYFGDQNHFEGSSEVYYSSSKRLIDDLQELCLRINKRGTIARLDPREATMKSGKVIRGGESYSMVVGKIDRLCIDRKKHIETDRYKGPVYCATVPNGTLVTRRNGSVLISGNCWAHSTVSANLLARARDNQPYVDLSAFGVAAPIKNFRNRGGNGIESVEYASEKGIPSSVTWPQQSMDRSNVNDAMYKDAARHKNVVYYELDPRDPQYLDMLLTANLLNMPTVDDYNWWGHSVCGCKVVKFDVKNPIRGLRRRIWNSWSDSWSDKGMGDLDGRKALPDNCIVVGLVTAAEN